MFDYQGDYQERRVKGACTGFKETILVIAGFLDCPKSSKRYHQIMIDLLLVYYKSRGEKTKEKRAQICTSN
jgi:hypothetical protein